MTGGDTKRDVKTADDVQPWNPLTRVAFRFCFLYFGLFCLWFAQITFAFTGLVAPMLPQRAVLWQMVVLEPVARWVGRQVFGADVSLHLDSGSGDQAVIWVMAFCGLVVAVAGTVVWSVLDRRRTEYRRLHAWFLTFLRICVGGQMMFYGMAKVIPSQMPAPSLTSLLQPFGEFSPMAVLWLQVGSSYPYEILLGAVELLAGILLFIPRTATLGALVGLVSMVQVFVLNMTFDVPVKILSSHLLLMTLVLLAPQARRLANVLVLERPADPVVTPRLFESARPNRIAAAVQVALGVWVLAGCVTIGVNGWFEFGGGRPKPELYGIWQVTDSAGGPAWRRVVVEEPDVLTYQSVSGELETVDLTTEPGSTFTFHRTAPDRLELTGRWDSGSFTMTLERVDLSEFPLLGRGFNWVQEYPYFG